MKILHLVETHRHWSEPFVWDLLIDRATHAVAARRSQRNSQAEFNVSPSFVWHADNWALEDNRPLGTPQEMYAWYRSVIQQECPDIVHVHFATEAAKLATLLLSLDQPVVVSIYGGDLCFALADDRCRRGLGQVLAKATVVTICCYLSEQVQLLGPKPEIVRLPAPTVSYAGQQSVMTARPLHLVAVGRLVEKKGLDVLLKAVSLAERPLHLSVIGSGPLDGKLRSMAMALNLNRDVVFLGRKPRSGVLEAMATADALVCPSRTADDGDEEGTPTVLLEAQSRGLPVVATLHAGIPEVVAPELRRLLCPEGSVVGLVRSLQVLVDEYSSFSRRAIARWVDGAHGRDIIHDQMLSVYKRAIHEHQTTV